MTNSHNACSADIEDAELDRINAWIASIGRITPKIRQRILDLVGRLDKCRDSRPLVYALSHNDPITVGDIRSIAIALEDDIGDDAQPEQLRSSGHAEQNSSSKTWTAGIDALRQYPYQDEQWHIHAIEFHHKVREEAEATRDRWLASQPSPAATVTDGSIQEGDVLSYTMDDGVGKVTAHVRPHNGSSADSEILRPSPCPQEAHDPCVWPRCDCAPRTLNEPQAAPETPFADGLKEARDQLIKVRDAIIESGALNNRDKYLDLGIETNRVIDRAWNLLNFSTPVTRPQSGGGDHG